MKITAGQYAETADEASLHAQAVEYLNLTLPRSAVVHHSPNEGKRGRKAQAQLRASGVLAGMPDLAIFHEGRAYFIELKTASGRLSEAQRQAHERLERAGFDVTIVRNLDELRTNLVRWNFLRVVGGVQ